MSVSTQHARDILQQAELLCSAEQVQASLHKVARQINAALAETHPLVLSVMGGAVVFTGQLLPMLDFPLDFDYVHVSRYGDARHGGQMHWKVEPHENVRGRVVLVLTIFSMKATLWRRYASACWNWARANSTARCSPISGMAGPSRSMPILSGWNCRTALCLVMAWTSKGRGAICPPFMQ